jgi:Major Facilitator Superfamily
MDENGILPQAQRAGFRPRSLDAVNFLLADVRGALGPYLNVFLITQQHWSQTEVGWVTTISGLLGLAAQTPAGATIDSTRRKRGAVVLALIVLAIGALMIFAAPRFWPVMMANTAIAVVGDVFGPAVAAVTLGLYARRHLARRMGRNSAFDHAGNVAIAAAAGGIGYLFSQRAVFLLVPVFSLLAAIAMLSIPGSAVDQDRARGLGESERPEAEDGERPSGYSALLRCRPLVVFAVCAMLFHFANAPLLPLVGQKLAQTYPAWATAMMSAHYAASSAGRRADGGPHRTQADPTRGVRRSAGARAALHVLEQYALVDRGAAARRDRSRHLRRHHAAGHRRSHARHRPLQPGAGRRGYSARGRCLPERLGGRSYCGPHWLLGGFLDVRGGSLHGTRGLILGDAGDRTEPSGRS